MDLIKSILEQFAGDNLDKLCSQLGTNAKSARSAIEAAVPALLSGLSGLASSDDGAQRIAATLGNVDQADFGNLGKVLSGASGSLAQKGGSLLSSLFNENVLSGIISAVGRYAHLDAATVKKLLSFVSPLILSKIAGAWTNKGGTPAALQGLLAEQKENIADALPSGFSLAGIPGVDAATRMVDRTAQAAGDASRHVADAAKSTGSWLLPLATAAIILGLGLWYMFTRTPPADVRADRPPEATGKPAKDAAAAAERTAEAAKKGTENTVTALKPTIPDTAAISKDLSNVFKSAKEHLAGIKNADSARAALPQLKELNTGIDRIRDQIDKLPAAGQATMGKLVGEQLEPIEQQASKILEMPGLSDDVRSTIEGITHKLAGLNLAQVSDEATGILAQLTKTLNGVKDDATAKEALPQLKEVGAKIDSLKQIQSQMSPAGQTMLAKVISAARGPLTQLVAKVVGTLDSEAGAIKSVLDEIIKKLAGMAPAQDS